MVKPDKKEKKSKRAEEVADAPAEDVEMDVEEVVAEDVTSKKKKEKDDIIVSVEDLSPLAQPLAQKKMLKKLHKTIKKASKQRQLKRGVKEVVKSIRKGERGLLVLAADISPIDIISHLPVLAEDAQIPYIFVPSKEELGHASATKRPTSCVMVCPDSKVKSKKTAAGSAAEDKEDDYREIYNECCSEVQKLDSAIVF